MFQIVCSDASIQQGTHLHIEIFGDYPADPRDEDSYDGDVFTLLTADNLEGSVTLHNADSCFFPRSEGRAFVKFYLPSSEEEITVTAMVADHPCPSNE